MGSLITFSIGKLELDWAKNSISRDYRTVFQPSDLSEADYYYANDEIERRPAYVRPLRLTKDRLELLGYNLNYCLKHLSAVLSDVYDEGYPDFDSGVLDRFLRALRNVNPDKIKLDVDEDADYDFGEYASRFVFEDPQFARHMQVTRGVGEILENVDPLVTLRLLALNPRNLRRQIVWRFQDLLGGGWTDEEELRPTLPPEAKFLIVTEGSTDSFIIQKAVELLRPDVSDFFTFIDMKEHYPFTGTGNLVNFIKGLAKIGVINKVLCIFDNDAEGRMQMRRLGDVPMAHNISVVTLPDLPPSRKFKTLGTNGERQEGVNGRAVSIECFLDLRGQPSPKIRWTNFVQEVDSYQGAILDKDRYTRRFKKVSSLGDEYDFSGLRKVVGFVIKECVALTSKLPPSS